MKRFHKIFQLWGIVVSMLVILLVLSAATYAWFSTNRVVTTDRATARSGTDSLQLQISESGGSDFHGENKLGIHLGSGTGDLVVPYGFVQKLSAWKENRI